MGDGTFSKSQVDALISHVDATIGRDKKQWAAWPGGWPGELGTALIDAVFSARATYKTKRGRGIHAQVVEWQASTGDARISVAALRSEIEAATPSEWARRFGNEQHSPGRPPEALGGPTKAAAALEAAQLLGSADPPVDSAADVTDANAAQVRRLLLDVPGIGYATANYFLMLLGRPGVKPDRMVHRFINDAMTAAGQPDRLSDPAAEALVNAAASEIGSEGYQLEHAIWKWESDRAAGST